MSRMLGAIAQEHEAFTARTPARNFLAVSKMTFKYVCRATPYMELRVLLTRKFSPREDFDGRYARVNIGNAIVKIRGMSYCKWPKCRVSYIRPMQCLMV